MKKRILIVTKFYYRRGGDCIYALNLERLLTENGHEVAVFAMKFPENEPSQWSEYWPEQIDFSAGPAGKVNAFKRMMGMGDVKAAFARMMRDFRPDVVHLNNIHSYLSPVVAGIARKAGARVVWTLHDYKLICPAYSCLRDGKPCEICFDNKRNVLKTRCMKGSLMASAMAFLEARRWNKGLLQRYTDTFICPSSFMADKMRQGGFNPQKLKHLCNFVAPEMISANASSPADYYCYIGRLSEEKGIATLLEAASQLPYKLKIAGGGPMTDELKQKYAGKKNLEFLGQVDASKVRRILSEARFSVIPSECYENNPLSVIESFCAGTPVVGARIGGIPELISHDRGITFTSGDVSDLRRAISEAWQADFDRAAIQRQAHEEFSPDAYYRALTRLIY